MKQTIWFVESQEFDDVLVPLEIDVDNEERIVEAEGLTATDTVGVSYHRGFMHLYKEE